MVEFISTEFFELLNEADRKKILLLSILRSHNRRLSLTEIEAAWEKEGGRPLTKENKNGKRTTDNTIRKIINDLISQGFVARTLVNGKNLYTLTSRVAYLKERLLEPENIPDLLRWALTFQKYNGLPFMEELMDMFDAPFDEILHQFEIHPGDIQPIIEFETTQNIYVGWKNNSHVYDITSKVSDHLSYLYKTISYAKERKTIEFTYRSFQTGQLQVYSQIEPHFLKEHNKRWYLLGFEPNSQQMRPFSLDRIIAFTFNYLEAKPYKLRQAFQPSSFWKNAVGIYVNEEAVVMDVSFELKNGPRYHNLNYLISQPLHHSQKAIRIDDVWMRFEYKVQLGPELVRQIRQWGIHNLRNILPAELDDDVRNA